MLRVIQHETLASCASLRVELDALNRRARRPCPYSTLAYFENFLAHDECDVEGATARLLFLTVHDAARVVGYAALRRRRTWQLGAGFGKLEFLTNRDADRPHLVCAPEDEARCAEAVVRHLLDLRPRWTYLELMDQEPDSPLWRALRELAPPSIRIAAVAGHDTSLIHVRWPTAAAYVAALGARKREAVRRTVRKLVAAGRVGLVRSTDRESARALLVPYLAMERWSWKSAARTGIGRDPRRVALYEGLCDPSQPMRVGVRLLTLDDAPIAGVIDGAFDDTVHFLDGAFDARAEQLSPGRTMMLLAILDWMREGFSTVDLRNDYAYYKTEWLAEAWTNVHVRVVRRRSLANVMLHLGDLRRRWRATPPTRGNAAKRALPDSRRRAPAPDERDDTRRVLAATLAAHANIDVCDEDTLLASLPWTMRRAEATRGADATVHRQASR